MIANELINIFRELSYYEKLNDRMFPSIAFHRTFRTLNSGVNLIYGNPVVVINKDGVETRLGASSSSIVNEYHETGLCQRLLEYRKMFKSSDKDQVDLSDLMKVSGIGPAKATMLYDSTGCKTVRELCRILPEVGEIIPGTTMRYTSGISVGIKKYLTVGDKRISYETADSLINDILVYVQSWIGGIKCEIIPCGSYRRRKSTIGDIDLVVICDVVEDRNYIHDIVRNGYDDIYVDGDKKISGIIQNTQVDVRFINSKESGCHILHATGSADYNREIRGYVKYRGMKLNEYCITDENGKEIYFTSEKDVYRFLGLPFVDPTDR